MIVITMLNQKGGVGKTSCTFHLSGTLAAMGRRVLLLDNDPQSSLTQGFFGPTATQALDPATTIAALYSGLRPFVEDVVRPTGIPGVDILPGSRAIKRFNVPDYAAAEVETQLCIETFLTDAGGDLWDLVLIDCPPNLHLCSWAALAASRYLVVPTQPEDFGAQGLRDVQESADEVRATINPELSLLGYVLTRVGARKVVHQNYEEVLRNQYGPEVFAARVPDNVAYVEAIAARRPIAQHKAKGPPTVAMRELAQELLSRIEIAEDRGQLDLPRAEVA